MATRACYLDTNLIIGLAQEDLPPPEMAALLALLKLRKTGDVSLYTSRVAMEELGRKASSGPRAEDVIYLLLDNVEETPEDVTMPSVFGSAPYGVATFGGGYAVTNEMLGRLRTILPDDDDARHIFQAAASGMDCFVTCDAHTILKHTAKVEAEVDILLRSPAQLVAELLAAMS